MHQATKKRFSLTFFFFFLTYILFFLIKCLVKFIHSWMLMPVCLLPHSLQVCTWTLHDGLLSAINHGLWFRHLVKKQQSVQTAGCSHLILTFWVPGTPGQQMSTSVIYYIWKSSTPGRLLYLDWVTVSLLMDRTSVHEEDGSDSYFQVSEWHWLVNWASGGKCFRL